MSDALISGRFSVYETQNGGAHIALQLDGEEDTRHMEFPRAILKMAAMSCGGRDPLAMIKDFKANGG
jgi:hypothetical protein